MRGGRAIVKVTVGTGIGAFCLWLALRQVALSEVIDALDRFDHRWLVAAFAVSLAIQVLRAWRWQLELTPLARLPYGLLWKCVSVAYMMINVLPFRLGEPVRPLLLSWKTGLAIPAIVGNWIFEKMMDTAVMVLLVHATLLMTDLPPWARKASTGSLVMFLSLLFLVVGFWLRGEKFFDRTVARALPEHSCAKVRHVLQHAREGLQILPDKRLVAAVFGVTLLLWLLPIFSSWLLIQGFGFQVPPSAAFCVFLCVGVGTALPNPPGMVGIFQIASVVALGLYGVPRSDAVAYGIVLNALQLFSLVLQGVIAMPLLGVGISRLTHAAVESHHQAKPCPAAPQH
ncbi:MAG TPA: lysylphosphatidylglycerol synthase transmembrane domain-containing protein [Candidatus Binatia bacterium]|jgi:hypothetical protein